MAADAGTSFRPLRQERPPLPYRPRPVGNPAYVRFGDLEPGSVEVFVEASALARMGEIARCSWPEEAIGLLAGRACRDRQGTFAVVEAVEAARPGESEASAGSVHLSAPGWAALQRRLAHRYPAIDPVGWFHSHPHSRAVFSSEDRREQTTWGDPHSVGIVAGRGWDGCGSSFGVYAGPHALLLTQRDTTASPTLATTRAIVRAGEMRAQPRGGTTARRPGSRRGRRRLRAAVALLLALAALALTASSLWRLPLEQRRAPRAPARPVRSADSPPGQRPSGTDGLQRRSRDTPLPALWWTR